MTVWKGRAVKKDFRKGGYSILIGGKRKGDNRTRIPQAIFQSSGLENSYWGGRRGGGSVCQFARGKKEGSLEKKKRDLLLF